MVIQDLVYRIGATNAGLKTVIRDSQQSIRSLMDTAEQGVRSLENMSKKMSRTGTILFTGVSALTKKTIDSAASFEKSMRRVQAVSQSTASEYQKLSAAALEMSTKTEHSALAVADGMNFMAMAGFKANQIMEAMPSVLQLASAGVMDLGTAADITTNILTGYGMEISELAAANDVLVSAMTGANVDLVGLGQSFKYAGPLAKAAGIEFSETAAMIALMGNAGIQGSMAGTSLRQAITNLLNPTKQARDIMDRLGIKTRDTNDNLLSMTEILRQLEDRGASASDMMILFGQRAGPAMSALLGQGVDELEKFQQRLGDAEGLATRIEAMMVDTAEGQKTIFKNTANAIRIIFGQDMIPYYRTAVFFLQGIADRIKQMEPEQRMQIIRITAITGAVVGLVAVLGFLGIAVAGIVKGFLAFGGAIMFLMSAKGLAIGAIILAVGLLKKAWDSDFGGIKTKTLEVWGVVEPILTDFWEFLQRSWEWVIHWGGEAYKWLTETTWMQKKEDMQGWFKDGWTWVLTHSGKAWDWLTEGGISNSLDTLKAKIADTEAWKWVITTVGDAFDYVMESSFGQKLEELRTKLTDSTLWKWTIDTALPAILEGGEIVLKAVIEAGGKLYDAIKKGLAGEGWGDFWDVAEDIWSTGVLIAVGLKLATTAGAAILTAIGAVFGNAAGTLGVGGVPLAIGLLSVGIQLAEALGEGHFADFAENILFAALAGVLVGLAFDPALGMLAFNVALNLKLGENIIGALSDQIQYLRYMLENMNLVDILLKRNHPEDLMSFGEWLYWRETGTLPGEPTSGVFSVPGTSGSYDDVFGTGTAFPTSPFESYAKDEFDLILKAREGDVNAIQRLATEFGRYPKALQDDERPSTSQADLISIASRYSTPSHTSIKNINAMQKFFEQGGLDAAQKAANALGIPVEWVLAQWGLETSYFQSDNMDIFNLGGVKAAPGEKSAKRWTWEEVDGKKERVLADFKVYESIDEYVDDWVAAIGKKWKHAIDAATLEEYIAGLIDPSLYSPGEGWIGKYATDSNYLKSVEDVLFNIERYMAFDALEDMAATHGYDYVSHFVNGVANGAVELSEKAAEKFVQLVQRWVHDIPANDATAFRWGKDFVTYFVDGVEEEALNQQARMEEIASHMLMPMTFDNPENDAWIFGSGVDLVQWFGKGVSSAAQGVVEIVRMLMDRMFDAMLKVIRERYPELLEFFNSLKEEVDEGIKAVEEFVLKLGGGGDGEGEKTIKELDAVTTSWLQNLSNGLASAIVHGESLYDVFDNLLRMIAQQALSGFFMRGMTTILSTAGYSIPTMHFGGLVMHSGGMIEGLRPDEVPIIAQKGERILSRKQNDQFENMLANQQSGSGLQIDKVEIHAVDSKSFTDMLVNNPDAVTYIVGNNLINNGELRKLLMNMLG